LVDFERGYPDNGLNGAQAIERLERLKLALRQVNVVGYHHVIQYRETEPLLCFEERRAVSSYSRP
jgi:hypothetical protein